MKIIRSRNVMNRNALLLTILSPLGGIATARAQSQPAVPPNPDDMIGALRENDHGLPADLTVEFEMRGPAVWFDRQQGTQVSRCVFTSNAGTQGLSILNHYTSEPVYRPPGTEGYQPLDFDADLNLIVWRSIEKRAFSSTEANRVLDVQQLIRISPDGEIIERTPRTHIYEYPVGSRESIFEAHRMWLAAGRGYSQHLREGRTARRRDGRLVELVSTGEYGSGLGGTWELIVDPDKSFLVREGALQVESARRPAVRVLTNGLTLVQSHAPLAKHGTLLFAQSAGDYRVDYTVIEYRPANPDHAHLVRLQQVVGNPIPIGSEVVDYRGLRPRRYVAGEE